ncbi:MAG: hypothetical protein EOO85_10325 [Pedobacter sp.]|nr:MAG: hypothetical protein EOO85_10325 [Pedobacter sp.]
MNNDYRSLIENVKRRSNPEDLQLEKSFSDELSTISYSDVLIYVRLAMRGVEPDYTRITKLAGERVKSHLSVELTEVDFRYQGSVMTNTHIKSFSDVDLLVISKKFYYVDRSGISNILTDTSKISNYSTTQVSKLLVEDKVGTYFGNALEDLKQNRLLSENILSKTYGICDKSKPKSIKIKNTSLNRDVDIVIANWYDDVISVVNDKGQNRGIQVYNKDTESRGDADFPFLSIDRINERSAITAGRLKKMIRLLKNLKVKSTHDIVLSSFDINALCYSIPTYTYSSLKFDDLVEVLYDYIGNLLSNSQLLDNIVSVDGREYIFRYSVTKTISLRLIFSEIEGLFRDLQTIKTAY